MANCCPRTTGQRPITEVAIGPINDVNQDFNTSGTYIPGTLNIYLDGQLLRKDYTDGFAELGGTAFRMNVPPRSGSVVQARYTTVV
jgi:hypothetical protein